MAIQAIGGVSGTGYTTPASEAAPSETARRFEAERKDSTLVISKITREKPDGSTVTTITYADGHTKVETTPPKFAATENGANGADSKRLEGDGRVTAVDILA